MTMNLILPIDNTCIQSIYTMYVVYSLYICVYIDVCVIHTHMHIIYIVLYIEQRVFF